MRTSTTRITSRRLPIRRHSTSDSSNKVGQVDFSGNAVQGPPFNFQGSQTPVTDNGLTFPNFNTKGPLFQTNLIFPVPCEFISPALPHCSVIRPSSDQFSGAKAAAAALTNDGLFVGQTPAFFQALNLLAEEKKRTQPHANSKLLNAQFLGKWSRFSSYGGTARDHAITCDTKK
jgi:hypothetical protein